MGWLWNLDGPQTSQPCCDAAALAAARRLLGESPVRWAVATAGVITQRIIEQVPQEGAGPAPFEMLRRVCEASVLTTLCGLAEGTRPALGVSCEGAEAVRDIVRRGISLERVLRACRLGHAVLHQALREAAPGGELPEPVVEELFDAADRLAGEMAEIYVAERARWEVSEEAARCRLVEAIIAGEHADLVAAQRVLDYRLDRWHVAVILWREGPTGIGRHPDAITTELLATCGGQAMLQVAGHSSAVWLWIGFDARPTGMSWPTALPAGWRAAAGPPSPGLSGVRRSHLGARRAARIAATLPAGAGVCEHAEVRTACLLSEDIEQARWFAIEVLGALADGGDRPTQLRETLRCYLAAGRSLNASAQQLGIARNTVAYRVKQAEEVLGSPLSADLLDLRLALEILRYPRALDEGRSRPAATSMRGMYFKHALEP